MSTQAEIAKICKIDISSVNKILNDRPGAVFKPETIDRVLKTAKRLKYRLNPRGKAALRSILSELFPQDGDESKLAALRGVDIDRVREIRAFLRTV